MKKDLKLFLTVFISLCLLFIAFLIFSIYRGFSKNLNYNFTGVVHSVTYDEKGTPIIIINNQEYILNAGYDFNHQIEDGDTLKKVKGSDTYTLIKHATGKVIVFKN